MQKEEALGGAGDDDIIKSQGSGEDVPMNDAAGLDKFMMAGPLAPHVLAAQDQDANMAPSHLESHLIEYDEKLLGPQIDEDGRPIVRSEGKHPACKIPPEEGMPSERDLR